MRTRSASSRQRQLWATRTARALSALLLPLMFFAFGGCASLRHRGPSSEDLTAARERSRQGVAAMDAGQWTQAEDLLNKSVIGAPDDAATHRALADALWHRDAKKEAIAQIEQAVKLDPENAALRVRAGEMALNYGYGGRDAAREHAERAIRSDPKCAAAWTLRAHCFRQMNDTDRALADLQHALEFEPENGPVLLEVAQIYRERKQPARSLTAIHHLLDTYSPGGEPQQVLFLEGVTLVDLGRPQQACDVLVEANRRGQPNADGLFYLAQAYSAAGDVERASATAQQALALNASHQPSRQLLAQLATRANVGDVQRR